MRGFGFACALLFIVQQLWAQTVSLSGRVLDPSGAAVPSAIIELHRAGEQVFAQVSGPSGLYEFPAIPAGAYYVTARTENLIIKSPLRIRIDGSRNLDIELRLKATEQQTTVSEDPAAAGAGAGGSAAATIVTGGSLNSLTDNPEDLQADLVALAGPSAGMKEPEILIDGLTLGQLPPRDSIAEVRINENPFSPEYDRIGAGRIEILTRPAENRFHGSLAYTGSYGALNSRNPYARAKAPFLLQDAEANFTGPVSKNVAFSLALIFQQIDDGAVIDGITLAPKTLAPGPYTAVVRIPQHRTRYLPRIDYQLNEHNVLSFRYSLTPTTIGNTGAGGLDLQTRAYSNDAAYRNFQIFETSVHGDVVNATRLMLYQWRYRAYAADDGPVINVLGAFNGGGYTDARDSLLQRNYELQNNTHAVRGAHSFRFGVRERAETFDSAFPENYNGAFTFTGRLAPGLDANGDPIPGETIQISPIEQYRRTLLSLPGGGASQFTVVSGDPRADVYQVDGAAYAGDDWRIRQNLTLSAGIRLETQNNIRVRVDYAPRIGLAWAPWARNSSPGKTVIRAGFGVFYDRFSLVNKWNAVLYNGLTQQRYLVVDPAFFPNVPASATLPGSSPAEVFEKIDSGARAASTLQSVLSLERQLSRRTTAAVAYSDSHGAHEPLSRDINPPLPGTYAGPGTGKYPYPVNGPVYLLTSSGLFNQNQLIVSVNSNPSSAVSLFSSYTLNHALSNTDGINTYPGNPYSDAGEYGPAATDIRHRLQAGGSVGAPWDISLNPLLIVQSGAPFNITTGEDPYGAGLFFARPGIASDASKPGLIATKYGLLDPNPGPGEPILGRNAGRGPGMIALNLRVAKAWSFGPERAASAASRTGPFAAASSSRKYSLILAVSARNILNHTNPGPIIGIVTSPLFGMSNQVAGFYSADPSGFTTSANNRRIEMQLRLAF